MFIGTRLVTHALSCVHSAFASCERSFEKKRKVFLLPSPSGPLPQFRPHRATQRLSAGRARDHPVMEIVPNKALSLSLSLSLSVCVTPPLPSTLRWMQTTSSLGVLPTSSSGLLPSSPPTILHTLAILKTYIHLLPPSLLMLRLELSVLRCFSSFASSSHLRPPLFRRSALASLRLAKISDFREA